MTDTHTVLKGAALVLKAVSGPGGRDAVYGAQCTTCRDTSGQGGDVARSVGAWAIEHTRTHPDHRGYHSVVRTQWRVDPDATPPRPDTAPAQTGSGQPAPSGPSDDEPRPKGAHHARPLPSWRLALSTAARGAGMRIRRAWTWIQAWTLPIAGPLFLASISAALGFFVGALSVLPTG